MELASAPHRAGAARSRALAWAAYAAAVAALLLGLQLFHVQSVRDVLGWPLAFPAVFLANLAILGLFFAGLYALFNSAFLALAALSPLVLAMGYADRTKLAILNQPVLPSDLLFLRELAALEGYYARLAGLGLLALALAAIGLRRVWGRIPHLPARPLPRLGILACVGGMLGYGLSAPSTHPEGLNRALGVRNIHWDPIQNYKQNGVLYGFLMYAEGALIREPPGYGREAMAQRLERYPPVPARAGARRPNVIVYMSESFWDPRNDPGLELGFDPVPRFRALRERGEGFQLVTSAFGGNTCDPEFEVLTGLPVKYFTPGSRAFQQYVRRPIPSLARLFARHGYRTAGIHTYHRWFWGRERVYPLLGFDVFRGLEDLPSPERKGDYPADRMLTRAVVDEAQRAQGPWFVFAISVQNHGPYRADRYPRVDHEVPAGALSEEAAAELRTYAQGLVDADRSLDELVRFVDAQEEPTVLLFFGDHLPGVDRVYEETGFFAESLGRAEVARRRYTEAGVVHANFPIPSPGGRLMSTEFVPLYVAELAGLELPPFYGFLSDVRARFPGFSRDLVVDAAGNPVAPDDPAVRAVDEAYWPIVYDVLFGANHAAEYFPPVRSRPAAARSAVGRDPPPGGRR
jgi:phosphoglycerol transferase MdoB-like AlkP superfamily enzyme